MRKKIGYLIAVVLVLMTIAVACTEKSQESVVSKLEGKIEAMDGYKVDAEMKMMTGEEEQKYNIAILHNKEEYYRVELTNNQDDKGSQVILKNKDGVFVLTPELNKSFKFQSEWPDNSSQPYLYESLVKDIMEDPEAEFKVTDSEYVFHTKTNYQNNNNLPAQEVHIDKKSYTPKLVKVLDKDNNALVEVTFSEFEMDPSFNETDFEIDESMKEETEDSDESEETDETANAPVSEEDEMDSFSVSFPLFTAGSELEEKKEVSLDDGDRIIMTFSGEKNFTLIQERLETVPTLSSPKEVEGDIVNLGFTIGALSENTVEWNHDGVDFHLASEDLTKEELIEVAQSVQGKEVK